ncbi:FHA domain-containing protein, partial [Frankia tisae]|uniref:FHA domain-containing protein n=2 Tax=Frankia tisae TaxID=2950104 RepID=UPI0021BF4BA5
MSTAVLKVTSDAGQVIVSTGQQRFIIGRARNADHVIADSRVSRQHLMIEETDHGWAVRDVSSNGTWLDGSRMLNMVEVGGETRFRLGTSTGPEVIVRTELPARRSASDGIYGEATDVQTMLPNQTGYAPPRTSNKPTRPARREDHDAGPRGTHDSGRRDGAAHDQAESGGRTRLDREHERGATYPLRPGTMTIGRARDNDIVITDLLASRHHASLLVRGPHVDLVDLDSANGTFLDGRRIQ